MYLIDQLKIQLVKNQKRFRWLYLALALIILSLAYLSWQLNTSQQKVRDSAAIVEKSEVLMARFDSLWQQNKMLEEANLKMQRENEILIENSDRTDGIFFEVVIGGFEDFNLAGYMEDLANTKKIKYDGSQKLIVARFRSFKKALLFENDLKRIGLKDVEIVGRIDGTLVPFKEALKAGQNQK